MSKKLPAFVEGYASSDNVLYQAIADLAKTAFSGDALDMKTKLFIALAIDSVKGASGGVESLSRQAREAGASEQEICEVIRIAYYIAGMETLSAGSHAFKK